MIYSWMLWLPQALTAAGVDCVTVPGWTRRGHSVQWWDGQPYQFAPRAVMVHHDASPPGDSPGALDWIIGGFASDSDNQFDAHCWVDRGGRWHVIAAGLAQHAGTGAGWGVLPANQGNEFSLGVETDHTEGEAWPAVQLDSLKRGCAAICADRGWGPARCVVGHKEYAPGRKTDPDPLDMDAFRGEVAALIAEGLDDVSYGDVVQALRDVLRLPASGLAVPRGQADNGNLAAILVGMAQGEVNRDAAEAAQLRALAAQLDPTKLADAVIARLPGAGNTVPGPADIEAAIRKTFAEAFPPVGAK